MRVRVNFTVIMPGSFKKKIMIRLLQYSSTGELLASEEGKKGFSLSEFRA